MKNNNIKSKLYILSIIMVIIGYIVTSSMLIPTKTTSFLIATLIILMSMCLNYYIFKNGDDKLRFVPAGLIIACYIYIYFNMDLFDNWFKLYLISDYVYFLGLILYIVGLLIPYKEEQAVESKKIKIGNIILTVLGTIVAIIIINFIKNYSMPNINNSFSREVKNIIKAAQQQWVIDGSMEANTSACCYAHLSNSDDNMSALSSNTTELTLSGRNNVRYMVCINKMGRITSFAATDNYYVISYSGTDGIEPKDITTASANLEYKAGSDIDGQASAQVYLVSNTKGKTKAEISTSGICTGEDVSDCSVHLTLK